ncbi:MAG: tRNA (adenosine(37)-N6)-dimethylallyltransferase MiaA [Oscillospiraceae bacterium]|nr:tRNA (adenosine(37)-N6)-dimethylallyltransferase MiaA [Oscillospiraceae bacterium]
MKNIICVAGPTASGKTSLAVELAKFTNGEVVSCDSMQIYRRMTIGTAKPVPEEMDGIRHHMIDIIEPDEDFSVSRYCEMATPIVEDILERGKTAIIAGGTGLYMDSLIKGNDFAPFPATGHRQRLEAKLAAVGLDSLLAELSSVDPEAATRSQNNPRRIIRALEVYYETGETITAHNLRTQAIPPRFDPLWLGLDFDPRQLLYDRIDLRVDIMLRQGLLEEIKALLDSGIPESCTAMQAIGYKEFIAAMSGAMTVEEAAEDLKQASRRYAKRQLTWFKRNKNIHWLTRTADTSPAEILEKARQLAVESDKE